MQIIVHRSEGRNGFLSCPQEVDLQGVNPVYGIHWRALWALLTLGGRACLPWSRPAQPLSTLVLLYRDLHFGIFSTMRSRIHRAIDRHVRHVQRASVSAINHDAKLGKINLCLEGVIAAFLCYWCSLANPYKFTAALAQKFFGNRSIFLATLPNCGQPAPWHLQTGSMSCPTCRVQALNQTRLLQLLGHGLLQIFFSIPKCIGSLSNFASGRLDLSAELAINTIDSPDEPESELSAFKLQNFGLLLLHSCIRRS